MGLAEGFLIHDVLSLEYANTLVYKGLFFIAKQCKAKRRRRLSAGPDTGRSIEYWLLKYAFQHIAVWYSSAFNVIPASCTWAALDRLFESFGSGVGP